MIDIALCFHDSDGLYYRKATTTMVSVFENTRSSVHVHIVHDETLAPGKQNEMLSVATAYSQKLTFHLAPDIDGCIVDGVPKCFGQGTLYRLFLHQLIEADKIIYLDCDIVCELDIKELYEYELSNMPLAAVIDYGIAVENTHYAQSIGINKAKYFNAGVLLLNLQWFRTSGEKIIEFMKRELNHGTRLLFADQDILNIFFDKTEENIIYLDEKFNYVTVHQGREMREFSHYRGKILHMLGSNKPWARFSYASLFYWKYYNKTPWGTDAFNDLLHTKHNDSLDIACFFLKGNKKDLAWARRYRDYRALGFLGYLKKRIAKKKNNSADAL